jgi:hypothetical protein
MKKIVIVGFILIQTHLLFAQNVCKKTSVYFDVDQFNLTPGALFRIDSVLQSYNDNRILVELYGYADSSASSDHNFKLAQNRIASVKTYIQTKYKKDFIIREKNFGEEFNTHVFDKQWMDRRVDIFIFPVSNNKIVLTNQTSKEAAEVPLDYFEPCGVCASNTAIRAYYTDEDANQAGIQFESVSGEDLTTAGTVKLDYTLCNQERKNDTLVFKIKAEKLDTAMTIWAPDTINGIVYWRDLGIKPFWDSATSSYIVATNLDFFNLDKYACKPFDERYTLILPEKFKAVYSYAIDTSGYKKLRTDKDTISIGTRLQLNFLSYGIIDKDVYYLNAGLDSLAKKIENNTVPFDFYKPLAYTANMVKVKFSNGARPEVFGYYNSGCEEFLSLAIENPRSVQVKQIAEGMYNFAFVKNNKVYVFTVDNVKAAYSKKKKCYKIKLNFEALEKLIHYSASDKTIAEDE